ncbi:MAG TPA: 50S ribosomal protein L9 [Candidatus Latescibacteria bacterium]|nr:50S ribosomal protein L9 [Candidatus Latescibacterota bacterium]
MEVILKQEVERLGNAGEIVRVSDGFARNYLIPKGLALEATRSNIVLYEEGKKQELIRKTKEKRAALALAEKLEKISLTAVVPVGEEDRVFGSVTSQTIAELFKEKGYEIDRRKIVLDSPIKALGVYTIVIRLHPEVETQVKLWVVKE